VADKFNESEDVKKNVSREWLIDSSSIDEIVDRELLEVRPPCNNNDLLKRRFEEIEKKKAELKILRMDGGGEDENTVYVIDTSGSMIGAAGEAVRKRILSRLEKMKVKLDSETNQKMTKFAIVASSDYAGGFTYQLTEAGFIQLIDKLHLEKSLDSFTSEVTSDFSFSNNQHLHHLNIIVAKNYLENLYIGNGDSNISPAISRFNDSTDIEGVNYSRIFVMTDGEFDIEEYHFIKNNIAEKRFNKRIDVLHFNNVFNPQVITGSNDLILLSRLNYNIARFEGVNGNKQYQLEGSQLVELAQKLLSKSSETQGQMTLSLPEMKLIQKGLVERGVSDFLEEQAQYIQTNRLNFSLYSGENTPSKRYAYGCLRALAPVTKGTYYDLGLPPQFIEYRINQLTDELNTEIGDYEKTLDKECPEVGPHESEVEK
jgi:hypothetical protein